MSTSRTVNKDRVGVIQFTFTAGHLSCRVYWLQHIQRAEISRLTITFSSELGLTHLFQRNKLKEKKTVKLMPHFMSNTSSLIRPFVLGNIRLEVDN